MQTADSKEAITVKQDRNWAVYTYYFRSAGYGILVSFLAFTIIEAFCSSFQSLSGVNHIVRRKKTDILIALWIQWWVEANEEQPKQQLGMYLGVYGLIFGLAFLSLVIGCWYVSWMQFYFRTDRRSQVAICSSPEQYFTQFAFRSSQNSA